MRRWKPPGFTLIELLITLTVVAMLAALGAPTLATLIRNNRATSQANTLVSALYLARSEAVTLGLPVTLCASRDGSRCAGTDDWHQGWIVFSDGNGVRGAVDAPDDKIVQVYPALTGDVRLQAGRADLRYRPDGFLDHGAAVRFQLRSTPACHDGAQRDTTVTLTGRPETTRVDCP